MANCTDCSGFIDDNGWCDCNRPTPEQLRRSIRTQADEVIADLRDQLAAATARALVAEKQATEWRHDAETQHAKGESCMRLRSQITELGRQIRGLMKQVEYEKRGFFRRKRAVARQWAELVDQRDEARDKLARFVEETGSEMAEVRAVVEAARAYLVDNPDLKGGSLRQLADAIDVLDGKSKYSGMIVHSPGMISFDFRHLRDKGKSDE